MLITGAAGFIGGPLLQRFLLAGWEVFGAVRRPGAVLPLGVVPLEMELSDDSGVRTGVGRARPHVVVHLAARSSVADSLANPGGVLIENVAAQANLLEAIRTEAPGARIVVAGSADEYSVRNHEEGPIAETCFLGPRSPYGHSKVLQEFAAYQFGARFGFEVMTVRPFLTLGPRRADTFVGGRVARQIASLALGGGTGDVLVADPTIERDFTDVRDVAEAIYLVAMRGAPGEAYNIASGCGRTVADLVHAMVRHVGVRAGICVHANSSPRNEPHRMVGDASRLRGQTAWSPRISFEQSAADTVEDWIRKLMSEGE